MLYRLAPHVYLAIVNDDVVLLDAGRDRYACLAASDADVMRTSDQPGVWSDTPLVRELVDAGYLEASLAAPTHAPIAPARAERDLHTLGAPRMPLRAGDLAMATLSALSSALRLRCERPRHWLSRPGSTSGQDRAIALAARFDEARLYLPALARCLPRSLALLDFLSRHDSSAQRVFGVRSHPFEAHCWVQTGDIVLNDSVTRTLWYTPIAWN